ncbi:hypothetical protein EDF62_1625 [Leucobacter luti]|uniref:Uncharacterized protein n=1 Tax=Leucobacter luti TaxID=340320 RepID=A0A4V3CY17_9MICO|nr:hypothetical protein EDF62_1625 [Leucobacter luti]
MSLMTNFTEYTTAQAFATSQMDAAPATTTPVCATITIVALTASMWC